MKLRVACAQINVTVGDIPGNQAKILDYLGRAKKEGAHIVLFPELAISGYPPEDLLLKPHFIRACEDCLYTVAEEADGIIAVVGVPLLDEDVFNVAAVCAEGEVGLAYRKILLPNYGVFDERRYFSAGEESTVITLDEARLGLTVCEDVWSGDGPHVDCVLGGGAQAILNISASPFHIHKTADRDRMLCQRAFDNGAFFIFCNLVGGQDELVFDGASCVIDQAGRVIARAPTFREDLLLADVDLSAALKGRLRDGRHREAAQNSRLIARPLTVTPVPLGDQPKGEDVSPSIVPIPDDLPQTLIALEMGFRDYVLKNGFSKVVLGISGGVDSALVAVLACRALGKDNILGVFMPSKFSSEESRVDAEALAENLGLELKRVPIDGVVAAFEKMLEVLFKGREPDVTEENLQTRIRGNILMAISNKLGHLLAATGNKSEMSTGYATLYGDMSGGFAPIKDVPKTMVYALCRLINEEAGKELIPRRVLSKEPTAELREDQKDTDTLPEYEVLDAILALYVEQEMSFGQVVAHGHDPATVGKVIRMVNASEFKRRQAPPGLKITPVALGKDRRIPITNHFGRVEVPTAVAVAPPGKGKKGKTR